MEPHDNNNNSFELRQYSTNFIEQLQHKDRQMRQEAYHALLELGPAVVPHLLDVLKDANSDIRYWGVDILGEIGDRRAVKSLAAIVTADDESADLRAEAAEALGKLGDPSVGNILIHTLQDSQVEPLIRSRAIVALERLADHNAVEPLVRILTHDKDEDVRACAAEALGHLGDARVIEPLITTLKEDDTIEVVWHAAASLGRLGDIRAVEPLLEVVLKSPPTYLGRLAALEALGVLGNEQILPTLRRVQQQDPLDQSTGAWFYQALATVIKSIEERYQGSV